VDVIVLMPEPVADAPNITARETGREDFSVISKPDGASP
jgi:hypothetical protein